MRGGIFSFPLQGMFDRTGSFSRWLSLGWGAVTAGFAAVVVATAVLARDERSRAAIAAAATVVAVGIAVVGLVAAARTSTPLAHREAGVRDAEIVHL